MSESTAAAKAPHQPSSAAAAGWIVGVVGVICLAGFLAPAGWNFAVIALALAGLLLVLGRAIVGRPLGALVNEQNVMSLSRLQMVVWTVIILAAYLAYAFVRIAAREPNPLDIRIDWHLLALMGISATSFVASPLILGTKKDKEPDPAVTAKTALVAGEELATVENNRQGTLYANTDQMDAQLTDLFQGDELGNTTHLDLAKLQMFFFTLIAAIAFVAMTLSNLTAVSPDLGGLPVLSDGFVAILGISHAGYLSSKGLDHTMVQ
jgi:hypothetical protein